MFDQGSEDALSEDAALFIHSCVASLTPRHLRLLLLTFHFMLFVGVFFYTHYLPSVMSFCLFAGVMHCNVPSGRSAFLWKDNKPHTHVEVTVMTTNGVSWCPWKHTFP